MLQKVGMDYRKSLPGDILEAWGGLGVEIGEMGNLGLQKGELPNSMLTSSMRIWAFHSQETLQQWKDAKATIKCIRKLF